jgi:hypothetical protein
MPERRFPLPWTVEEQDACFVVRDYNGAAAFRPEPLAMTLPTSKKSQRS